MTTKRDHTSTLQSVLRGQGLSVPDEDIYARRFHEKMPDACVAMYPTSGPGALDTMGDDETLQRPRIQVRVRNIDPNDAKADADKVWELLHDWDGGTDYQDNEKMRQSGPIPVPVDGDSRYHWAINVELFIKE